MSVKRGDTLIEVIFASLIFSIIIVSVTGMMNRGLTTVLAAGERTAARDEVNAQAEALRYIHNGWTAEKQNNPATWQYEKIWRGITGRAIEASQLPTLHSADVNCGGAFTETGRAFVINTRNLRLGDASNLVGARGDATVVTYSTTATAASGGLFVAPPLYPRIVYKSSAGSGETSEGVIQETVNYNWMFQVEGIWIFAVKSERMIAGDQPEFYDFHIRTCWWPPGSTTPDNAATIVRLYNPEAE